MRITRTFAGVTLSVAWLCVAAYLMLADLHATRAMTPNEWGDLLAGVFAPLAFLWLVIGYMQQGEELRLSTEALRLQAEELRNSVEQQRALVEVSRQQVDAEREALNHERRLREDLSMPRLSLVQGGTGFSGGGSSSYRFSMANAGHAATELVLRAEFADGSRLTFLAAPLFDRGAERGFVIERQERLPLDAGCMYIEYTDGLGRRRLDSFRFGRASEEERSALVFVRTEA